jgi:hypothetical protein
LFFSIATGTVSSLWAYCITPIPPAKPIARTKPPPTEIILLAARVPLPPVSRTRKDASTPKAAKKTPIALKRKLPKTPLIARIKTPKMATRLPTIARVRSELGSKAWLRAGAGGVVFRAGATGLTGALMAGEICTTGG